MTHTSNTSEYKHFQIFLDLICFISFCQFLFPNDVVLLVTSTTSLVLTSF
uniref:Uncharacterized protein n=1 Tax=Rhizophora mucronata TaxID=61149 RepID=A0A2P2PY20_RHIMU